MAVTVEPASLRALDDTGRTLATAAPSEAGWTVTATTPAGWKTFTRDVGDQAAAAQLLRRVAGHILDLEARILQAKADLVGLEPEEPAP